MNVSRTMLVLYSIALAIGASHAAAHGLKIEAVTSGTACTIHVAYESGESAGQANIEIISPNSKTPFQIAQTDVQGLFSFTVDKPGIWTINAEDGTGHHESTQVAIGVAGTGDNHPSRSLIAGNSRLVMIIIGMATIAMLTLGGLVFARARSDKSMRP